MSYIPIQNALTSNVSSTIFDVSDGTGSSVLTVTDGKIEMNADVVLKDKENDEEWILSVSKGKLVLTPNNKKAKRRYNLNELLDEEDV